MQKFHDNSGRGADVSADSMAERAFTDELQGLQKNILGGSGGLVFVFAFLILLGMGAIAFVYYNLILDTLVPQISLNVKFISNLLTQKIAYAAEQGVALENMRGLQEFIGDYIRENSAISHIVITDIKGRTLHLIDLLSKPLPLGAPDVLEDIIVFPNGEANKVGEVRVYLSFGTFQQIVNDLKYEVVTLSVIALLLSIDLLNSFYVMRIRDPLSEIFAHLGRLRQGQYTRRLNPLHSDEVQALCQNINIFISKCNDRFADFFYEAEESRNAQIDKEKGDKINSLISKVMSKYKFTQGRYVRPVSMQSAMAVKIPLLIFVMGQELATAFLPIYFRSLPSAISATPNFLVGLTFVGFLFAPLISMYFAKPLFRRFSMRFCLIVGCGWCMLTLYGLSRVTSFEQALFLRTLNGLGYGLIFLAAQIHIARLSSFRNRAQNSAVFARTMYAAVFFCPVIGGILAEQLGYRFIFVLAAVTCLFAIASMFVLLQGAERKKLHPESFENNKSPPPPTSDEQPRQAFNLKQAWLENHDIFVLAACGAVPAKLVHFGIIMFIMPLLLIDTGFRIVEVGRMIMLFGFLLLVCMPYVGKLVDKFQNATMMLMGGSLLSLLACAVLLFPDFYTLIVAVALFGIAQSMVLPPLLTLVQSLKNGAHLSEEESEKVIRHNLTLFRLAERIGLILGILLLSIFVGWGSYTYAFLFIVVYQIGAIILLYMSGFAHWRDSFQYVSAPKLTDNDI